MMNSSFSERLQSFNHFLMGAIIPIPIGMQNSIETINDFIEN